MQKILISAVAGLAVLSIGVGGVKADMVEATLSARKTSQDIAVDLEVKSAIALACGAGGSDLKSAANEHKITMNPIIGYGESTLDNNNTIVCEVLNNKGSNYNLSLKATELKNEKGDVFESVGTTIAGWPKDETKAYWGVKRIDQSWAADTYSGGFWKGIVANEAQELITNASGNAQYGFLVGAKIGQKADQAVGTYNTNITFTATSL